MNSQRIPQHPLLSKSGQAVRFDIRDWGQWSAYDHQLPHRHSFHEILFFTAGNASHEIDFATYQGTAGQIHFVASDNVHLLSREQNCQGFSILFSVDYFSEALIGQLPFYSARPFVQPEEQTFRTIIGLVDLIRVERVTSSIVSNQLVHAYAEAMILLLVKSMINLEEPKGASHSTEYILTFRKLIKENYKQHFTVEKYAELICISPKHLTELCKTETGKTPLKLIREQVISEAKRLFYHTKMSVKEVAYSLNFETPAGFSKYFKAATGHAPSFYKREVNNA